MSEFNRVDGTAWIASPDNSASYDDSQDEHHLLIRAVRGFLESLAAAAPDLAATQSLRADLEQWTNELDRSAVRLENQVHGQRFDLPQRGQSLTPLFTVSWKDESEVRGTVTFGRFYYGGGGAVYGGAIPLFIVDVLGQFANAPRRAAARAASLHVDYRAVTPAVVPLDFRAWVVGEEGRKLTLGIRLSHDETLCVEARCLFIAVRK